jgi:HSP20 family molecular chaperone IbpA
MSFLNTLIPSVGRTQDDLPETRRPHYEVSETENAYALTVNLPGVSRDGLEITDENGELRIAARRSPALPGGVFALHRETSDAPYGLVIAHDNTVDTGKIEADLKDGVLRLSLAKAESAKPRKIAVS